MAKVKLRLGLFREYAANLPQRDLPGRPPMLSTSEVLSAILEKPIDLDHVRSLVTDDVTGMLIVGAYPDGARRRVATRRGNPAEVEEVSTHGADLDGRLTQTRWRRGAVPTPGRVSAEFARSLPMWQLSNFVGGHTAARLSGSG
jgi:hypothetical protein